MRPVRSSAVWAVGLAVLTGCQAEPTGFSGQVDVTKFMTAVYAIVPGSAPVAARKIDLAGRPIAAPFAVSQTANADGVLRPGTFQRSNSGIAASLALESSFITGIPAKFRVSASQPFTRLVVTVTGAEGYWEILLPSAETDVQVIATGANDIPNSLFPLEVAVGDNQGYGPSAAKPVNAVILATADVAVILRWNTLSDVDLHVTDAKGQEVYFGNDETAEGGRLDLDSNPACNFDGVNQEVISWPVGSAPRGEYTVEVFYWSDCGQTQTDYTVSYMVRGQTVQQLTGTFTGAGSPSTGREIVRFQFP